MQGDMDAIGALENELSNAELQTMNFDLEIICLREELQRKTMS